MPNTEEFSPDFGLAAVALSRVDAALAMLARVEVRLVELDARVKELFDDDFPDDALLNSGGDFEVLGDPLLFRVPVLLGYQREDADSPWEIMSLEDMITNKALLTKYTKDATEDDLMALAWTVGPVRMYK